MRPLTEIAIQQQIAMINGVDQFEKECSLARDC